jgi:CheY-like chemotaxis protein
MQQMALVVDDSHVARMDGLAATQQIKADDNLKHIPVVVCTGHDTDAMQFLAELKAMVKQYLLPTMQQELRELTETVSREVANDTAQHRIAEQLELLSNNQQEPQQDEKSLLATVTKTIEQDLLPKMHKDVHEIAEDINRRVAADTAEKMVAEQVKLSVEAMLPALTEQLLAQAQRVTEELANSVAKHAAHDAVANSAEKAVQNAAKESDFPRQIMVMLNTEGEVWLQRHEQQMLEQLMQQVEAKFSPMVMTYLNAHLTQMIAPIARAVVEESLAGTTTQSDAVTKISNDDLGLKKLSQQVFILKVAILGLAGIVLAEVMNL